MKTAIISWLQNDGSRGFSVDQLKEKQLLPMFRPDALVIFRVKCENYTTCSHAPSWEDTHVLEVGVWVESAPPLICFIVAVQQPSSSNSSSLFEAPDRGSGEDMEVLLNL